MHICLCVSLCLFKFVYMCGYVYMLYDYACVCFSLSSVCDFVCGECLWVFCICVSKCASEREVYVICVCI